MEQEEKYTSRLGAYPVIYVTLKDAGLMNYEMMLMQLKTIMMEVYYEDRHLLEGEISEGEREFVSGLLLGLGLGAAVLGLFFLLRTLPWK